MGNVTLRWIPSFYLEDSGASPVEDFLGGLQADARLQILAAIEKLCILRQTAKPPLIGHVRDKLWELRVERRTNIFRLIYCVDNGHVIFLYGFQKKEQKISKREFTIAQKRYQKHLDRQNGKKK
ncbi:type II toxin-antitoxin system RelE/ParE family toxin [Tengunoibacter tsumagoiensis]|uniref:Toxin RelE n=1 Tax=Tengunoibacter tsumagoiensis TaxID=2014871 RepID=A0A401ZVR2_9CHLR|nr:type II toxin-antitoxin system RelE/ParE family toxin [Tengunoibacter tsumagoiensis]GCE10824.1 hypothetical protein KTT_06830 [Tengunoibacter tsumagoiensis]